MGFSGGSNNKESTFNTGDLGLIPRLGRSPGGRHSNPFQYSCLENPMARGVWWAKYCPWGHKESDPTSNLAHTHTMRDDYTWLLVNLFT